MTQLNTGTFFKHPKDWRKIVQEYLANLRVPSGVMSMELTGRGWKVKFQDVSEGQSTLITIEREGIDYWDSEENEDE